MATHTDLVEAIVTKEATARKIGNAMRIDQQKISATRITTGTLAAETITLGQGGVLSAAGGMIQAGGALLNDQGVSLVNAFSDSSTMWPGNTNADWLTGPVGTHPSGSGASVPYAGLAMFNQASPSIRGAILEAIGVVTSAKVGKIIIRATDGATSGMAGDASTAYIELEAGGAGGPGLVNIKGDTNMVGGLAASGLIDFTGVSDWIHGGYKEVTISPGSQWGVDTPTASAKRIAALVVFSGRIKNNSGNVNGPGSLLCNLGPDFSPVQGKNFVAARQEGASNTFTGQTRLNLSTTGNLTIASAGGGTQNDVGAGQSVALDGICYAITN